MKSEWLQKGGYQEIFWKGGSITLEARPSYCDRGNFLAKVFSTELLTVHIDGQDGWPRYYFDEERAKLEVEAWIKKRNLWLK